MIKAKVISITYSDEIGGIPKLDLETYLEDPVVPELFCGADFWDGRDIVIMTKEDYESLRKKLNEKEGEICKMIVNNDIEQLRLKEKIRKLKEEIEAIQKDIKDLEEKMAQEADEVDIRPGGTIIFRKKRVSELEKKVKELEEKNKYLKKRLMTRYTVKFDADGAIIYPELKED